jgi:selenide, water dikinase
MIKLTALSKGSGCGCKIAPAILQQFLKPSVGNFSNLIGGYETNDDAAVWNLNEDTLLLSTTDFFSPILDDPFDFGRVAAANALSDIYAMGGTPVFALAILGFPVDKISPEIAGLIMDGGRTVCEQAGIPIAGGHSIDITEPVFGLAVTGTVHPLHLKKNNTAKEGDVLFLTKPIGTGIISAALKREKLNLSHLPEVIESMAKLNVIGPELAKITGVNAMTDVTGFGLLGHLIELCEGSGLSAEIYNSRIPLFPGVTDYASQFVFPDNTYRNWNAYEKKVTGIHGPEFITLCDPQTSGGILVSVSAEGINQVEELFKRQKLNNHLTPVGKLISSGTHVISVQ